MEAIQIRYDSGRRHSAIKACMDSVKKHYKNYEVITDNEYPSPFFRASSDYHRLFLATQISDMVYADNDLFVRKPLRKLKKGLPYFAMSGRRPDIFYFAVNGRSDLFHQALDVCYRGIPETYREMVDFNKRIAEFFQDKFYPIDNSTYFHIMAHKWSERVWMTKLKQGFCIPCKKKKPAKKQT